MLNFGKFDVQLESITFLGHVICKNSISDDPAKIEVVVKWERLKNMTEIHSYLGLAGYIDDVIDGFSSLASLVTLLT